MNTYQVRDINTKEYVHIQSNPGSNYQFETTEYIFGFKVGSARFINTHSATLVAVHIRKHTKRKVVITYSGD